MWVVESVEVCILPVGWEIFPLKDFNGKMLGKTDLKNNRTPMHSCIQTDLLSLCSRGEGA